MSARRLCQTPRRLRLLLTLTGGALLVALAVGSPALAGGGNSANAQTCNHNGWQTVVRTNGTMFTNTGDCVSYAAQGGTLVPFTGCFVLDAKNSSNFSDSSLSAVVAAAAANDSLKVEGTCAGTTTLDRNLTITGTAAPGYTTPTLDGGKAGSVLTIDPSTNVTINGLTITHGAAKNGGGISIEAATVTLTNDRITDNAASGAGGGIYADTAIGAAIGTAVTCTGCTLQGNSAAYGGGAAIVNSILTLHSSTVSANNASVDGGGLYLYHGDSPPFALAMTMRTLRRVVFRTRTIASATINDSTICPEGTIEVGSGCPTIAEVLNDTTISGNSATIGASVYEVSSTVNTDSSVTIEGGVTNEGGCNVIDPAITFTASDGENLGPVLFTSLQLAVTAASPGDAIEVAGTCTGTTVINKPLAISNQSGYVGVLDGGGSGPVVTVDSNTTVTIEDLVIQNGNNTVADVNAGGVGFGGGIVNNGNLTLNQVTVTDNKASERGGGIYNHGVLTLTKSEISDNTVSAGGGGGIFDFFGTVTVSNNSVIAGNSAATGGGVVEDGGAFEMDTSSSINNNTAAAVGGGIDLLTADGSVTLNTGAVITMNTATDGGGIYNDSGLGTITGDGTGSVTGNTPNNISTT